MAEGEPEQSFEAEKSPVVLVIVAVLCLAVCALMVMLPPGSLLVDAVYGGF